MTKLRGRHYATKARATAAITTATSSTPTNPSNNNNHNSIRQSHRFRNNTGDSNTTDYDTPSNCIANNNSSRKINNNIIISGGGINGGGSGKNSNNDNDNTTNYGGDGDGDGDEVIDREIQLVQNISDRLETGLDEFALRAILDLLKRGEQPDAIVAVVMSLAQRPTR